MKRTKFAFYFIFFIFVGSAFIGYLDWMSKAADTPGQGAVLDRSSSSVLKFLVLGDQGSGTERQRSVANSMEKKCEEGVDGVLLLGDNFYPNGVSSIDDPQWRSKFEDVYSGPCLSKTPFFVTMGNHDYQGSPYAVLQYRSINERWVAPGRFYGVKFGDLLEIINFDTTMADWCFSDKNCSFTFLLKSLGKPKLTKWRVVVGHHPLRSSSLKGFTYDGRDPRSFFMRKAICGKADLGLFGHSHHLEMRRDDDCTTPFGILGAGGGDLAEVSPLGTPVFLRETYGFGLLTASREELVLDFYDGAGEALHRERVQ